MPDARRSLAATAAPPARATARSRARLLALAAAGLLHAATGAAAGGAEVSLTQATAAGDAPLARPTIGVGSGTVGQLPFHVTLTHRCPAGTAAAQLFVNVADSARLVEAGAPGEARLVTVPVPLRQLQWLAQPAALCATATAQRAPDESGADGLRVFRLHAGTTGFATVACSDASGRTLAVATASAPLDVWLSCPAP